jgi:hypothetical protein
MLDQLGQLLRAAVGFATLPMPSYIDRALWALRSWLDSWSGIGRIAVGMHRQGYDLQLTQYDERDGHRVGDDALAGGGASRVGRALASGARVSILVRVIRQFEAAWARDLRSDAPPPTNRRKCR